MNQVALTVIAITMFAISAIQNTPASNSTPNIKWTQWYSSSWATTSWMQPLEYHTISSNSSTYITKICVTSTTDGVFDIPSSIQASYSDGNISGTGARDNSSCFQVNTTQNEYLVSASVYTGAHLNSIQFGTSTGRNKRWGVASGNDWYTAYINENTSISQIEFGRSTQLYKDQMLSIRFGFIQHYGMTSSAPTKSNPTTTTPNPKTTTPNPTISTINYETTTQSTDVISGLQCNGLEANSSGIVMAIPAGVCMNADPSSSYMLTCNDNIMQSEIYLSRDCSDSSRKVPTAQIFPPYLFDNIRTVCDRDPCEYIDITIYNDTFDNMSECQQYDRQTAPFTQSIYVKSYCNSMWFSSMIHQCDDNSVTTVYFDNTRCINDGLTSADYLKVGPNQCISDSDNLDADIPEGKIAAVDISCDVAASAISSKNTSTTTSASTPKWSNGLQCNGIETKSDMIKAIPAGVCVSESVTLSYKLKCSSNTMEYYSYSSSDCSGYSKVLPITTVFSSDKYDDVNIVCDMSPCKYTSIIHYNITFSNASDCETFDHETVPFTQEIYIDGYCNSILGYQSDKVYCNNQYATMTAYFDDDKCMGSGEMHNVHFNVGDGKCISNNTMNGEVMLIDIECGIAESDTTAQHASIWVIILVIIIFFIIFILIVVYIRCKEKLRRWRGIGLVNFAIEFNKLADGSTANNNS